MDPNWDEHFSGDVHISKSSGLELEWLGGGNSKIFGMFTPNLGGRFPQFDGHIFSDGLVETTN